MNPELRGILLSNQDTEHLAEIPRGTSQRSGALYLSLRIPKRLIFESRV